MVLGLHFDITDLNVVPKLWQTWTFFFAAKLHLSVHFFPPGFICEKPLQCLYHLLFGSLALVGRQTSCAADEDFSSGRIMVPRVRAHRVAHLVHLPWGDKTFTNFWEGERVQVGLGVFTEMYRLMENLKIRLQLISLNDLSQQKRFYSANLK